ncbi:hypothetical protein RMATCC62417_05821 [Rhizopus microsporus]|nr:hypothetical protein RMATCC62417_05821 [Rhizopus microsporus]
MQHKIKGAPFGIIQTTANNRGILKLYHESEDKTSTRIVLTNTTVLCTHSIPFHISIPEFLSFIAPVETHVSHYRVIKEANKDTYMVLMKFKESQAANIYFEQYNNRLFSSMEPETCQVLYVESAETDQDSEPLFILVNPEEACSVCLEPLGESKSGILTILCQHTFHCHCLLKWKDGSCPVCRYSQKKTVTEDGSGSHKASQETEERVIGQSDDNDNECAECKTKEGLWICLICGYVGCGRYQGAHAYKHYRETEHIYALDIASQRVWDYVGDGYVHRLVQNMADGKLVELPDNTTPDNTASSQEKLEAIALEYSYMLTTQLDSQRIYYENQIDKISSQLIKLTTQLKQLEIQAKNAVKENEYLERQISLKEKEASKVMDGKQVAEKSYEIWKEKLEALKDLWLKEKEMTNTLIQSNEELSKSNELATNSISELNDQVRDLKFFLEARKKVQADPSLEGGSVETRQSSRRRKGKRRPEGR